jgi:hypothetical protein
LNILCNYTSGSIGVSKDFIKNIRKKHPMTIGENTYLDIGKIAYIEHFTNKNELDA